MATLKRRNIKRISGFVLIFFCTLAITIQFSIDDHQEPISQTDRSINILEDESSDRQPIEIFSASKLQPAPDFSNLESTLIFLNQLKNAKDLGFNKMTLHDLKNLKRLDLSSVELSGEDLKQLNTIPELVELYIPFSVFNEPDCIYELGKLTTLKKLAFCNSPSLSMTAVAEFEKKLALNDCDIEFSPDISYHND